MPQTASDRQTQLLERIRELEGIVERKTALINRLVEEMRKRSDSRNDLPDEEFGA